MPAAATLLLIVAGAGLLFGLASIARAQEPGSSSLHAGSVTMRNPTERQLFERLLCECGDCARLPLSTCSCGWAEDMRARLRTDLAEGKPPLAIQDDYREEFGAAAIAIPADEGFGRVMWALPVSLIALAAGGLWMFGRRMQARGQAASEAESGALSVAVAATPAAGTDDYDDRLERELDALDD